MLVFLSTSEEALEVYQALRDTLQASGLQLRTSISPQAPDLGSAPFQQVGHSDLIVFLQRMYVMITSILFPPFQ